MVILNLLANRFYTPTMVGVEQASSGYAIGRRRFQPNTRSLGPLSMSQQDLPSSLVIDIATHTHTLLVTRKGRDVGLMSTFVYFLKVAQCESFRFWWHLSFG